MPTERPGRPKKDPTKKLGVQVGLRLKDDLAVLVDRKALELELLHPGSTWSRNDVVRYMLYRAFEEEEGKRGEVRSAQSSYRSE